MLINVEMSRELSFSAYLGRGRPNLIGKYVVVSRSSHSKRVYYTGNLSNIWSRSIYDAILFDNIEDAIRQERSILLGSAYILPVTESMIKEELF